jgi:uncharacterized protein with GYD domain
MEPYVVLAKLTQSGQKTFSSSAAQLDVVRQHAHALGARLQSYYLTIGEYDIVAVIEAPDGKTMAKLSLAIGASGTLRTLTLRAFSETAIRNLIGTL